MARKYDALSTIARIYQFLGYLVMLGGFIVVAGSIVDSLTRPAFPSRAGGLIPILVSLFVPFIGAVVSGIALIAIGQLINLLQDLELNSREAAEHAKASAEYNRQLVGIMRQMAENRRQRNQQQPPS